MSINSWGTLNNVPPFNRGSFCFRVAQWTENELFALSEKVAVSAVFYYFSKYGEENYPRSLIYAGAIPSLSPQPFLARCLLKLLNEIFFHNILSLTMVCK